jgi:Ca2+-binding RTX toxin-like protein
MDAAAYGRNAQGDTDMSFNFTLSGSTLSFDFIAATAAGNAIIETPTTLEWNPAVAAHFFEDTFFAVDWRVTGDLPPFDVSPVLAALNPLAQVRGILDVPSGQVVATFSGRIKAADGTSDYLTLEFLTTSTWGEFFDLGKDSIRLSGGPDTVDAMSGNDQVFGLGGDDILLGGTGRDTIKGGGGIDTINGNEGADRLFGGSGGDIITGEGGNDRINGQNGSDAMEGGDGNDIINGGKGDDLMSGGAGRDTMKGGNGDDRLILDGGNDKAWGNGGSDEFVLMTDTEARIARVYTFTDNVDTLIFDRAIFDTEQAVVDAASPGSGRVYIDMGTDGTLILFGITDANVLLDDIGFL